MTNSTEKKRKLIRRIYLYSVAAVFVCILYIIGVNSIHIRQSRRPTFGSLPIPPAELDGTKLLAAWEDGAEDAYDNQGNCFPDGCRDAVIFFGEAKITEKNGIHWISFPTAEVTISALGSKSTDIRSMIYHPEDFKKHGLPKDGEEWYIYARPDSKGYWIIWEAMKKEVPQ